MSLLALACIAVGFAVSCPLTWLLVRLGHRVGALDVAGSAGHAKALRAVPNVGGIAITAAVVVPMAAGLVLMALAGESIARDHLPALARWTDRIASSTPTAAVMLGGVLVLHVLGLVDDRRPLGPFLKLGVQIAVAAVLVVWFDVRLLTVLDTALPLGSWPSCVITVLWIVVVTNAINFLDNMDGLAAGTAAIAAALFMVAAILNEQWFIAGTLGLLSGGLAGFLVFNFPPARIFMGDGGSLVVGFLLAVLTARTTFYGGGDAVGQLAHGVQDVPDVGAAAAPGGGWYAVFMPLVVLAIPLYDFTSVTMIRLLQGKSPFVGDQQHFSHRLVQRGLSRRGAVLVIWSATLVTGIGGISLGSLQPWQAILVGVQTLAVLLMLALLEHASRHAVGRGGDA